MHPMSGGLPKSCQEAPGVVIVVVVIVVVVVVDM